ncbi:hypothetical protein ACFL9T_05230 [Thermodesulfobacteriota bacterium]
MECPLCSCRNFYVKNPDDDYETYEFDIEGEEISFSDEVDESECPQIGRGTETYCGRCAWHGKFEELK